MLPTCGAPALGGDRRSQCRGGNSRDNDDPRRRRYDSGSLKSSPTAATPEPPLPPPLLSRPPSLVWMSPICGEFPVGATMMATPLATTMIKAPTNEDAAAFSDDFLWRDDEIAFLKDLLLTPGDGGEFELFDLNDEPPPRTPVAPVSTPTTRPRRPITPTSAKSSTSDASTPAKRSRASASPRAGPKRPRPRPPPRSLTPGFKVLTSTQCLQHIHQSFKLLTSFKQELHQLQGPEIGQPLPGGWALSCFQLHQLAASPHGASPGLLLAKTVERLSVQDLMHQTWKLWTDPAALMKMYPSKQFEIKILQRFNGDGVILQQDTSEMVSAPSHPRALAPLLSRSIYMLFRIETKQGFTVCARSLDSAGHHFAQVFHWITFSADEDERVVNVEFGARVQTPTIPLGPQMHYAYHVNEVLQQATRSYLFALQRWEELVADIPDDTL